MVGRTGAKEEALEFFIFFIFFGGEAYVAAVALFICIIVQAGLWALERCFVCHSLAGPGIWGGAGVGGGEGLESRFRHDQYSGRLTSRAKARSARIWIHIYICMYFFFFFYYCYVLLLLCVVIYFSFSPPFLFANSLR